MKVRKAFLKPFAILMAFCMVVQLSGAAVAETINEVFIEVEGEGA